MQRISLVSAWPMLLALIFGAGALLWTGGSRAEGHPTCPTQSTDFEYELFISVLEGLYADGVSDAAVDAVTVKDPVHGYPANFVWSCPVCMPTYRAFLTYRARPKFDWIKGSQDFGKGLDEATLNALTMGELAARQKALMELTGRWVERRMNLLRLTPKERAAWNEEMEMRRKKGMAILADYKAQGLGGSYAEMKGCPLCDGANNPFAERTLRR